MHKESDIRLPLILGDKSYKDITDDIIRPIEAKPPKTWYILLMISIVIALWGIGCIVYLLGGSYFSLAAFPDMYNQVVTINGVSKSFAMT